MPEKDETEACTDCVCFENLGVACICHDPEVDATRAQLHISNYACSKFRHKRSCVSKRIYENVDKIARWFNWDIRHAGLSGPHVVIEVREGYSRGIYFEKQWHMCVVIAYAEIEAAKRGYELQQMKDGYRVKQLDTNGKEIGGSKTYICHNTDLNSVLTAKLNALAEVAEVKDESRVRTTLVP